MASGVVVVGADNVIAMFARAALAAVEAENAMKSVLAQEVEAGAKAQAPVLTGALRDSIAAGPDNVTVGVEYAGFVEYGTVNMPPEPFLRPAADTVDGTPAEAAGLAVMMGI